MPYSGQVVITPPGDVAYRCSIELDEESVAIAPEGAAPILLPLVDIDDIHDEDYTLRLTDFEGRRYDLSMLGKAYGQIAADVRKRRDEKLGHDLLLTGVNLQDTFPAKLFGGVEPLACEVRMFEDLMVVVPERGRMWGTPYAFIEQVAVDEGAYQVRVVTDDGAVMTFGHLAKRTDEFAKELRRLLDRAAARTARTLGSLVPGVAPAAMSRLAVEMRDGRAAQQWAVDAIDPSLWPRLEEAVVGTESLRQTFDTLKSMCPPGWAAFGIKAVLSEEEEEKPEQAPDAADPLAGAASQGVAGLGNVAGLLGGVTGQQPATEAEGAEAEATEEEEEEPPQDEERAKTVMWFFTPLARDGRPVNLVAQEITSEKGHATYLFRLMPDEQFRSLGETELAGAVAEGIRKLNRALLTLNFRREPIYLPEDQINTPRYGKYVVALRKLPYLKFARESFVTRLIHNTTWQQHLQDAIRQA